METFKDTVNMNTKLYNYNRKSTDTEDKQILSLDSQMQEMESLAKSKGLKIDKTLEESMSAKKPGRPIFNQMLDEIKQSKTPCSIITWHPNRLTRNNIDMAELVELVEGGKIAEIITYSQVFRNTPMDMFMFNFLCAQGKLDNDNKAIDIKRGMKAKALTGYYPSKSPLGYTENKNEDIKIRKKIPSKDFQLLRKAIDLILNKTYTPSQMLEIINEGWKLRTNNGCKISKNTFYKKFLKNPFIYGEFQWGGIWIKGTHKPMVSKEEWVQLQKIIDGNRTNKIKPQDKEFTYGNGMILCGECGNPVIGYDRFKNQKNGITRHYQYYECKKDKNCSQKTTEGKVIEEQVLQFLSAIEMPKELHDLGIEWVKEENQNRNKENQDHFDNLSKRYQHLQTSMSTLVDMRAGGSINQEVFDKKKIEYEKELVGLQEQIDTLSKDTIEWLDVASKTFTFSEYALKMYRTNDVKLKKQILRAFGSNLTLKDKKLNLSKDSWVYPMQKIVIEMKKINLAFEPLNDKLYKAYFDKMFSSSLLCPQ